MAEQNRAIVVTAHGGTGVLQVQERPVEQPGPGQVQVRVAASGINFMDVYQREGVYPTAPPFVLGTEGAGTVTAVGSGVADVAVGDLVAWANGPGCHADVVVLDAAAVVPVPAGMPPELAAASMLQGMTAHYLVNSTYPVQSGDAVLVHAAAGGTGQLLVQLAAARGARVIGTVSTAAKEARARELGAHEVIRYTEVEDVAAAVRAANGGNGVAVVYDGVGKDTFDASLDSLAIRGMLVIFGAASGQVPPFDVQRLNRGGSLFLTRPTLVHYIRTRDELLWRAGEVLSAVASGQLQVEIGGRYDLTKAGAAYDDLETRRSTGKLLLVR
jgi:NADPH2:quinone reductase